LVQIIENQQYTRQKTENHVANNISAFIGVS